MHDSDVAPAPSDERGMSTHREHLDPMTLRRGDAATIVSRYDGTAIPIIVTAPVEAGVLHASLAASPIGTPLRIAHWTFHSSSRAPGVAVLTSLAVA